MESSTRPTSEFVLVAALEVDTVRPQKAGFALHAQGEDAADYIVELHLDMPLDGRTRAVLAELLVQSEWRIWRKPAASLKSRLRSRATPQSVPKGTS